MKRQKMRQDAMPGSESGAFADDADSVNPADRRVTDRDEESLLLALNQQLKSAPWYIGSVSAHLVFFLILMLIPVEPHKTKDGGIIFVRVIDPEQEYFNPPEKIEEDNLKSDSLVTDVPDNSPQIDVSVTDIDINALKLFDKVEETNETPDLALETLDPREAALTPTMVVDGAMQLAKCGSKLAYRTSAKLRNAAIILGGGDQSTIAAADAALQWLAAHQEMDGRWDPRRFGNHQALTAGATAVALLAFVGSGNTPEVGRYRLQVGRAAKWLLRHQEPNGLIGLHSEAGVTLMVLAETYDLCTDRKLKAKLKAAAEKLGDYCERTQFRCGGWDYFPEPWQTNQLITGWYVLGLKSARLAGVHISDKVYERSIAYFDHATNNSGWTFNTMRIDADTRPEELNPQHHVIGSMALACLQFLGRPREDPKVQGCAKMACTRLPNAWANEEIDYSYIYYQGLGLFQLGTLSEYWQQFNKPMKETLLELQVKDGSYRENKGSWPPSRRDPMHWGRIGSTAMGCLTLQIYYLYKNSGV